MQNGKQAARFQKAKAEQARLKISKYGPPGSGKTFTALLMAEGLAKVRERRIAYVDTERGTDFYAQAVKARGLHPEAFDFDALYTKSLAEVTEAVRALDPKVHGIIVLDSISHLWDAAMDAYEGKRTRIDGIPLAAWGRIKKPYKDLIKWLIASPYDVFILGRQKNVFEMDEEKDELVKTGVGMRAEGETAYEPHICIRMEAKVDRADSTKSIYLAHVEKDRTGVLAGKTFQNPNFATISPLLSLLGPTQAAAEDEDERVAQDSELLERTSSDKAEAKDAKSADLFQGFQADIALASSVSAIAKVGEAIKKQRRYLTEEHEKVLREVYRGRRDKLISQEAPEM